MTIETRVAWTVRFSIDAAELVGPERVLQRGRLRARPRSR